jgi:hypothetical protein
MNTYNFTSFDLNDCCEYFESNDPAQWDKIKNFIVYDGDDAKSIMDEEFDMYMDEADNTTYEAFDAGIQYALRRVNEVLEAAGVDLEIAQTDLGNNYGYILNVVGDDPEDFIKRVMKKPRRVVDSWV